MHKFHEERMMKIRHLMVYLLLALLPPAFSGCWYVAAAGVGAYGGYKMKEKGYKVQSPVKKDSSKKNDYENK